ncbi:unnamed protein product [Oikopleura dioica]|uniref:Alpha-1,4-N-acetylglucosaminyltransferase n=2 Tax=Oikopleura dioica TaxID=34765 RepID=E4WPV5_OIKDI|nr:unnamed protein product [Oikopleura dioica]
MIAANYSNLASPLKSVKFFLLGFFRRRRLYTRIFAFICVVYLIHQFNQSYRPLAPSRGVKDKKYVKKSVRSRNVKLPKPDSRKENIPSISSNTEAPSSIPPEQLVPVVVTEQLNTPTTDTTKTSTSEHLENHINDLIQESLVVSKAKFPEVVESSKDIFETKKKEENKIIEEIIQSMPLAHKSSTTLNLVTQATKKHKMKFPVPKRFRSGTSVLPRVTDAPRTSVKELGTTSSSLNSKTSTKFEPLDLDDLIDNQFYHSLPDDLGLFLKHPNEEIDENLIKEELYRLSSTSNEDEILEEVMGEYSSSEKIPNVMHFVSFGCRSFKPYNFLSWVSAFLFQKPDLIILHTDCSPQTSLWHKFEELAGDNLKILPRTPPNSIWGKELTSVEHQSDITRLHILLKFGGIYLDDDVLILKSLDEFRSKEIVLGEENYDALANSIILAKKNTWFMKRWLWEYRYYDQTWSSQSCFAPWSIWHLFPDSIHIVKNTLLRPNWEEIALIYKKRWNWRHNYSIHLFSRFIPYLDDPDRPLEEIRKLNSTYGEIANFILSELSKTTSNNKM